jgi:hypothetical protein
MKKTKEFAKSETRIKRTKTIAAKAKKELQRFKSYLQIE